VKTQAKVLRVLQEQVVEPVGGTAGVRVDVRVIAATNKELPAEIRAGRFREDLYFRLNVIPIFVPPLHDRKDDIPRLAEHFMSGFAREYGRRMKTLDASAVAALQEYAWPGNVRELRNVIERLIIMVPGDTIGARDLVFLEGPFLPYAETAVSAEGGAGPTLHAARSRFEREFILKALAAQNGNISRTAEVLGVERSNLYRKMRALGIAARPIDREEEPA
jgi:two-component system, NtrC family, nitrogen regulation response regulator NtrX